MNQENPSSTEKVLNERELEDDYPMYPGYMYVLVTDTGEEIVYRNSNMGRVKQAIGKLHFDNRDDAITVVAVKNCDIFGRNLSEQMI